MIHVGCCSQHCGCLLFFFFFFLHLLFGRLCVLFLLFEGLQVGAKFTKRFHCSLEGTKGFQEARCDPQFIPDFANIWGYSGDVAFLFFVLKAKVEISPQNMNISLFEANNYEMKYIIKRCWGGKKLCWRSVSHVFCDSVTHGLVCWAILKLESKWNKSILWPEHVCRIIRNKIC